MNSYLFPNMIYYPKNGPLPSYPDSDYHWLVRVLNELIAFVHRDENHGIPELVENDYDWAHALAAYDTAIQLQPDYAEPI